ncbi:MAG: helix-turn-helix transcriptional regulator [Oscillospiraceae bacterium]
MLNMRQIGTRIKKMREQANLTQTHIAEFLAVDQSLISKYEKGERAIGTDVLDKLATLFCCPITALVEDSKTVPSINIAFRTSAISGEDLAIMSQINKIALNQDQMDELTGGVSNDR